jgi:putative flippase GtrA
MNTRQQLITFFFVGLMNTAFSYSIYSFFIFVGLHYTIAAFFSTCLGVLFNFKTTGGIVFKNKNNLLLFKFIGVYAFLYCCNITLIRFLHLFSDNLYLDGFIAIIPLAMLAFILNKFIVFRQSSPA